MTWTFTRHEQPQRLAAIMRRAWRLYRRRVHSGFGRCLKAAWKAARKAAGNRLPPRPPSLIPFLRGRGGLKPCPEVKHVRAPLVLLSRRGLALDNAARLATDAGYDVRDDANRLLDCLRDEMFGIRQIAAGDIAIERELDDWEAYHADMMEHALT